MKMPKLETDIDGRGGTRVAVGAGGAIAASKSSPTLGERILARVAGHLGISTQKSGTRRTAAAVDQVDADLKAGRITKAQADELKARIKAGNAPFFAPPHRFGEDRGFGGGFHRGGHLSAAADYLGLTVPQLLQKLSGSTRRWPMSPKAQGKSVDGLKQAMLADAKKTPRPGREDGMITEAHSDKQELSELKSRIDAIVNGTFRGTGRREEFRFRGGPDRDAGMFLPAPSPIVSRTEE